MSLNNLIHTFNIVFYGLNCIGFGKSKNFHRHVRKYRLASFSERWKIIGNRFQSALEKVAYKN